MDEFINSPKESFYIVHKMTPWGYWLCAYLSIKFTQLLSLLLMFRILFFRLFLSITLCILSGAIYCDSTTTHTCYYHGYPLIIGPKGGCYYINGNGNKTYVDRSFCNC